LTGPNASIRVEKVGIALRVLITGICGFVGSTIAKTLVEQGYPCTIVGVDNLIRRGAESNWDRLQQLGIKVVHGDLRSQSDVDALPEFEWLIDAAANPSVLAGADGKTSSRQLMEHNLLGTIHLLERCKALRAGFVLLSTSRVYSIPPLAGLPVVAEREAFQLDTAQALPPGVTACGIDESFSTAAPVSLYGASKLASEMLALEYGATFDFPVWINRCGVLAGAGQFGRPDQGIFAFWLNAHLRRRPMKYIGFDGLGHQVRDCLHPSDLVPLILKQIDEPKSSEKPRLLNVSGGIESAMSLRQLTRWCDQEFGDHPVASDPRPRPFDLPWVVLDSRRACEAWGWKPTINVGSILSEIANHARKHPGWLDLSC
jgi:CDP-paratose 2-epimerase